MTHSQTAMLEELERRNYSQSTTRAYLATITDLGRYFQQAPEELTPEHIRQYQAYLFRERHLTTNTDATRGGVALFLQQSPEARLDR